MNHYAILQSQSPTPKSSKKFLKLILYEVLTLNMLENSAKNYNCIHGYHSLDCCFLHFNNSKILQYRNHIPI